MKRTIWLREEAEQDLSVAASWYEKQQTGLGHEFLDEVVAAFYSITEHPSMYPVVFRKTRRMLMRRFPFGIYFRIERAHIVVLAVMHGSQHPRRWRRRIS